MKSIFGVNSRMFDSLHKYGGSVDITRYRRFLLAKSVAGAYELLVGPKPHTL